MENLERAIGFNCGTIDAMRSRVSCTSILLVFIGASVILSACSDTLSWKMSFYQLKGSWHGGGGQITFMRNGRVKADHVSGICQFEMTGNGTWTFLNSLVVGAAGGQIGGKNYASGRYLALDFYDGSCLLFLINPHSPQPNGSVSKLCYLGDPDAGCVQPIFRRQV